MNRGTLKNRKYFHTLSLIDTITMESFLNKWIEKTRVFINE